MDSPTKKSRPCSQPLCPRPAKAKGLCTTHYRRQLRGRPVDGPERAPAGAGMVPLTVRIPAELAQAAEQAAEMEGLPVVEWWRQAGHAAVLRAEARRRGLIR